MISRVFSREYFCSKCYYTLVNAPRQPGEVTDYVRPEEKKEYDSINQCWKPWMETVSLSECWSCSKFTSQGRGGRPPKRKRQARTVAATTKDTEGQGRCDTLTTQCSTSGQFERTEQDTLPVPPSSPSQSVSCSDSQFQFEPLQHSTPIKKRKHYSQCNTSRKVDGTTTQTSPSMKYYYLTKDHTTKLTPVAVSYTHLTLPTRRTV